MSVNNVYIGQQLVDGIYRGSQQLDAIYFGADKIYPVSPPTPVGTPYLDVMGSAWIPTSVNPSTVYSTNNYLRIEIAVKAIPESATTGNAFSVFTTNGVFDIVDCDYNTLVVPKFIVGDQTVCSGVTGGTGYETPWTITIDNGQVTSTIGTATTTTTLTGTIPNDNIELFKGAVSPDTGPADDINVRFYYLKIWDSPTHLVHNFVPIFDGYATLQDMVAGTTYGKYGTGITSFDYETEADHITEFWIKYNTADGSIINPANRTSDLWWHTPSGSAVAGTDYDCVLRFSTFAYIPQGNVSFSPSYSNRALTKLETNGIVRLIRGGGQRAPFHGITSLTEVHIGQGVQYLDTNIFQECTNLTAVTFAKTLMYCNTNIFYCQNGNNVNTLTFEGLTPPKVESTTFYGLDDNGRHGTVYCPAQAVSAYTAWAADTQLSGWTVTAITE